MFSLFIMIIINFFIKSTKITFRTIKFKSFFSIYLFHNFKMLLFLYKNVIFIQKVWLQNGPNYNNYAHLRIAVISSIAICTPSALSSKYFIS